MQNLIFFTLLLTLSSASANSLTQDCKANDGDHRLQITYTNPGRDEPISNLEVDLTSQGITQRCLRDSKREELSGAANGNKPFFFRCNDTSSGKLAFHVGIIQKYGYSLLPIIRDAREGSHVYQELTTGAGYACDHEVTNVGQLL